ncbi:hypothetical protein F8S13_20625 [Chloroflexia bacterium SDU3-3]|nr:hypothetical protein F8S13_20625 [Chloroflexia bacterium SDU3-3]
MGNQREIQQVSPAQRLGVVIPIREGCAASVAAILAPHDRGRFYTYLIEPNTADSIPNLDGDDIHVGAQQAAQLVIQSGGKMWCGYEAFGQHIAQLAPYLSDALFFVGDDTGEIDRFQIAQGKLSICRVHTG